MKSLSKKERKLLNKIILSGMIFVLAICMRKFEIFERISGKEEISRIMEALIFLCSYLIVGFDVLKKAARNLYGGKWLDENFLMCIATIGAIILKEYPEAVAVMMFYNIGKLFEDIALSRSRASISNLMEICPEYANLEQNGEITQVAPEELQIGDRILVKVGERVPVDGKVIRGGSNLDTSAITGESKPVKITEGEHIISGCINLNSPLSVEVEKLFEESTVMRVLDLVENAMDKKSRSEQFITKFARYYTPVVVFCAAFLGIIFPLVTGDNFGMWVERALVFLVVSCPCALVISVPLGFFGGIGASSKEGILIKGSNYLEMLAKLNVLVLDKTGTLTEGKFEINKIYSRYLDDDKMLELLAYAEYYSDHPIAESIKSKYTEEIKVDRISDVEEVSGFGMRLKLDGVELLAGNGKWMEKNGISYQKCEEFGTLTHLASDGSYLGYILICDEIKKDSYYAMKELKNRGIKKLIMLTGDIHNSAKYTAQKLNLDEYHYGLLPQDKYSKIEEIMEKSGKNSVVGFVGDGINDAPVIARADIGISMGAAGTDAAIESADVVIMTDEISKLAIGIDIGKRTLAIVYQNIAFALGVKFSVLILSALGYSNMWLAIFADVGVSVLAILNSMRMMKSNKYKKLGEKYEITS